MVDFTLAVLSGMFCFAIGCIVYKMRSYEQRYQHVPGPRGLPFLGNILQFTMETSHKTLTDWAKVYGSVYKIKTMGRYTVIVNGYDAINECLVESGDKTGGRPSTFRVKYHLKNAGFTRLNPDATWKLLRKIFRQFAKPFGDGLHRMEDSVAAQSKDMFEKFDKAAQDGQDLDPMEIALDAALKVDALVTSGHLLTDDDPLFLDLKKYEPLVFQILGGTKKDFAILEVLPCLIHAPLPSSKLLKKAGALRTKILDELKVLSASRKPEDTLVGSLYQHKAKTSSTGTSGEADILPEDDILVAALGVLFSGRSTSGLSFTCLLNLLAHNQSVQNRIAEEIFAVCPDPDAYVTLKLQELMPFTRATLLEALRYHSVSAVPGLRATLDVSFTVRGIPMPPNTEFMYNLWGMHHDKGFWGDPEIFSPERFLDPDGNLVSTEDPKRRHLMPFGAGVRNCPGEQLARSRLFLWLANTCKRFEIVPGTGNTPDLAKAENFRSDFQMYPPRFKVRFQRR